MRILSVGSLKESGKPLGPEGKGYAYVPYLKNWLIGSSQWYSRSSSYVPQPGDIVVFNWNGGDPDHVGIVDSVNSDGSMYTIEGNTGDPSYKKPEGVYRKLRYPSTIEGYGHVF